jgi:23S rRNA G2069 N7-methylase RlmK/C1962 C5-methylase RlmI
VVSEYGRRFEISLHDGFSHGLFFDMRRVRADLAVRWQQRKVANLFAYTCSFSVYLAPSNEVVNVDVSKKYLDWGRRNHELNGLPTEGAFVARDAFEFLEIAKKRQHQWDAIIIDPPAYSRGKAGKSREFSLRKSLVPLIHEALDVLRPGGELFLSTNLAELEQHTFRSLVDRAAREHGSRLVKQWGPDIDYPAPAEEFHLKAALVVKR